MNGKETRLDQPDNVKGLLARIKEECSPEELQALAKEFLPEQMPYILEFLKKELPVKLGHYQGLP